MQVTFGMTNGGVQGIAVINIDNREYKFNKGVRNVTSKDEIEALMGSELFERGEMVLVTPHEEVARYLDGDIPDKFTKELLEQITEEGLIKLAKQYQTKEQRLVGLIKPQLRGKPISNAAQEIIDSHMKPKVSKADELLEKALADGTVAFSKPWYSARNGEYKTRSKDEILTWVTNNYDV